MQRDINYALTAPIPGSMVRSTDGNMIKAALAANKTVQREGGEEERSGSAER